MKFGPVKAPVTRRALPAALFLFAAVSATQARTLVVGPGRPLDVPSAAARAAQDGDVVLIEDGEYYDCAVWTANDLTIIGAGANVTITDTTCQGKALFVVTGDRMTVRNLTLARARVPDGNGAGIRLEGQGLTLEHVRFVNNQVGLLAGTLSSDAEVRVSSCSFEKGGSGGARPLFAVSVGSNRLLRIEESTFDGVEGGQILSAADRTELFGNWIATGTGEAPAAAVLATGSDVVMEDNLLTIGPNIPRPPAAVLATGQGAVALRRNRLINSTDEKVALLLDWTGSEPRLQDNHVEPDDDLWSDRGIWRHRASVAYYVMNDAVRAFAGRTKRWLGL